MPAMISLQGHDHRNAKLLHFLMEWDLKAFSCELSRIESHAALLFQVLYGILVQHFANLAATAPAPMPLLDTLTVQILEITAEVPLYAATIALARLKRMHETLAEAWQSPGMLLKLELWLLDAPAPAQSTELRSAQEFYWMTGKRKQTLPSIPVLSSSPFAMLCWQPWPKDVLSALSDLTTLSCSYLRMH